MSANGYCQRVVGEIDKKGIGVVLLTVRRPREIEPTNLSMATDRVAMV